MANLKLSELQKGKVYYAKIHTSVFGGSLAKEDYTDCLFYHYYGDGIWNVACKFTGSYKMDVRMVNDRFVKDLTCVNDTPNFTKSLESAGIPPIDSLMQVIEMLNENDVDVQAEELTEENLNIIRKNYARYQVLVTHFKNLLDVLMNGSDIQTEEKTYEPPKYTAPKKSLSEEYLTKISPGLRNASYVSGGAPIVETATYFKDSSLISNSETDDNI